MERDLKNTKLAHFLKNSRLNAHLSQQDVSSQLGYSTPQFVSNWERGISSPPIEVIGKLSRLYSVSAEDLFDVLQKEAMEQVADNLRRKFLAAKES